MKKRVMLFCLLLIIFVASCANSPDDAALSATIEAAVGRAIAEYAATNEAREAASAAGSSELVTKEELEASQKEQNQIIQEYVNRQIGAVVDAQLEASDPQEPQTPEKRITPTTEIENGPCDDQYEYLMDLNVPDGSDIPINSIFPKTWYIKNTGTCTWNSDYKLVYFGGEEVGTAKSFTILQPGDTLKPGESMAVTAELSAPTQVLGKHHVTTWAIKSDQNEVFGSGQFKDIYLRSDFITTKDFNFVKNFSSAICSDNNGYFTCGTSDLSGGRGVAYYDPSPTLESRRTGQPSIIAAPPSGMGGITRLEFGPIRMPVRSWFYTNFCCRPETPGCDVTIRLYVREPGYKEVLLEEKREWNDGFMSEWKFTMDTREQFDQDLYYIIELEANGMADSDDIIVFQNTRIY